MEFLECVDAVTVGLGVAAAAGKGALTFSEHNDVSSWAPPPARVLKCNVDAAIHADRATFGQFRCNDDLFLAEAMAVKEALSWIKSRPVNSYIVEIDCLNFCTSYNSIRQDCSHVGWYSMVFVPFTGVDNHKRCITFGAGLLTKEDVDSYSWLLEKFTCAMGKTPMCVVTDQNSATRIAIQQVLPECRHRYFMWHIMTKVNEKFGGELAKVTEFRKKLNAIVSNEGIHSVEFEAQWQLLMDEYNLSNHRWFCKMFAERESWIPAFFSDLPMSGLLRTTSRSEAENGVYGRFAHPHSSLVVFYMQFESVLGTQRYQQDKLNAECEGYLPKFKTPLAL
ncbi:PREDICTED: protein FAR1-RELATED SEQUENCE 4-like [Ipomoea nil]|uniref:protein FAR1-RELATED SEQUENCE 4-like n=1 Tax=Ipomoea nil TaxID=35883 RepID=UPI0009019233|nr:PREDICTED: protein FAR1-RELATED SEQUENCE 4-like [Ipomoea nil]